jgi:hypothetical protein
MTSAGPLRRLFLALIAGVVAACSVAAPSDSPASSPVPVSSEAASPPPSAVPSAEPSTGPISASPSADGPPLPSFDSPGPAAGWLLEQSSARFELDYKRFRTGETLRVAVADGIVDPAGDRGAMRYDLFPDDAPDTPMRIGADVVWSADDWWGQIEKPEWTHASRAEAPDRANLIGRVQEEPLALVRFAATADPERFEELPPADLHGQTAERWLIRVPAADAKAAFVPPDSYLGYAQIFDRDDLPLEVWLVDGRIARLGYVLEREKSPAGVPDRHETWYDWSAIGDPIDLVIPPAGKIREMGD